MSKNLPVQVSATLVVVTLLSAVPGWAQMPPHNWSHRFGELREDSGRDIAVDADGNVVMTGWIRGPVDFGGGVLPAYGGSDPDIYVVKFDAAGAHMWSRRFGDERDSEMGASVAVDPRGDVYVTGLFTGTADFGGGPLISAGATDIFVAKYSATGAHLWSHTFGAGNFDHGFGIDADMNGVVFAGAFQDTVDFGGGPLVSAGANDACVARFDTDGVHVWSRHFGDAALQIGRRIAVGPAGSAIVIGGYQGTIDFGGDPLTSAGGNDVFVARLDVAGGHIWSKRFGDVARDDVYGVAVDGSGSVVLTGVFEGSINFGGGLLTSAGDLDTYLVRLDAGGAHQWSQRFGDADFDYGAQVAVDGSHDVLATGIFRGTVDLGGGPLASAGGFDIYVAMYDSLGAHLWSQRYGDIFTDEGLGVAFDANGNAFLSGQFDGTVDFGGGPLTSFDDGDIFIAKYGDATTAVAISSFTAIPDPSGVTLRGSFNSDTSVRAVHVYRSNGVDGPLYRHDAVLQTDTQFLYHDNDVTPGRAYRYQIGVIDDDGEFFSRIVTVRTEGYGVALLQNSPNPFNPITTIRFTLDRAQPVTLSIYNARGRLIVTLIDELRSAGVHDVQWDGSDRAGSSVSSGVYFYRMKAGKTSHSRRMVLLK